MGKIIKIITHHNNPYSNAAKQACGAIKICMMEYDFYDFPCKAEGRDLLVCLLHI